MFKFLSNYFWLFLIALAVSACSKNTENDDIETDAKQSSAMFSGLSQNSLEKQKSNNTQQVATSKKILANVTPGYNISFPFDHRSHPEFAVEWWYLTANLTDQQNNPYALQWTLFRFTSDNQSTPWSNSQQYMGHVGLRDGKQAWFEERFARGGVGNAGVSSTPFNAYIDDWQWLAETSKMFPSKLGFSIDEQINVNLNFSTDKPFVKHGEQGFSRKLRDSEQASYYYSQPYIQVSGQLELPSGNVQVTGNAWFDHEWTSQYLSPLAQGWDWFSIHFDDGAKLMLFNMRHQQAKDYWSGTLLTADGNVVHLAEQDIRANVLKSSKVAERLLPLNWSIQLPKQQIDIQIAPMQNNQWNPGIFSYYEGGTVITGSHTGVGFIELTGY